MRKMLGVTGGTLVLLAALCPASLAPAGTGAGTIGTEKLHRMVVDNAYALEAGRALPYAIVDARTKKDYEEAHVFSAISMPAGDFGGSMHLLPKDTVAPLAVYCGDEAGTCMTWAEKATAAGYTNISIYSEGFAVWERKHMPVASTAAGR